MIKFDDVNAINEQLVLSQDAESDNRDMVRETHNFLDKRDGQWEPDIIQAMTGRPRYTFDKCNPVVDGISGEMEGAEFAIKVRPSGGDATQEVAKTYDGLIRNIQEMSNATHVFNSGGRAMIESGLGGWEVATDWIDADSFDQDFVIKWISNYEDRVWFDVAAVEQDMSDARFVFILDDITPDEYEDRFPEGSKQSVGSDRLFDSYENKPDFVTVGRLIYKQEITKDLVMMSDGSVYERDEKFATVEDDLAAQGIMVERERKKKTYKIMSRLFDGGAFLNEPEETVFKHLPVVPSFGNFKVREGKIIYRGAIEKLMDAQRTYNYTRSREIEDVALSPPDVTWATRKQLGNAADRKAASEMSVSAQRVYLYTADPEVAGPPLRTGGPQISAGLQQATINSLNDIQSSSARAPLMNGEIDSQLSGVAINALNARSDTGTIKYFKAQEVAIRRTAQILIAAIPNLYDSTAQKRILNEDGSYEMLELNKPTVDMATGRTVRLNDLSQGIYDVTCEVGEMFANRQQETVKSLNELALVVPELGQMTADLMLSNINAPAVDLAAERMRAKMLQAGMIPESQMTEQEKEDMQQAKMEAEQKPKEPTPEEQIAQAEIARVQAETQDVINRGELKQDELRIKEQDSLLKAQHNAEKLQMEELMLAMKQQDQQMDNQREMMEANMKGQAQVYDILNTQAQTLKLLREAMGADAIINEDATEAFEQQAETITYQQEQPEMMGDDQLVEILDEEESPENMTDEQLMRMLDSEEQKPQYWHKANPRAEPIIFCRTCTSYGFIDGS